ncbi:L-threonylcarbamoyladenylate synthase [soil metagenome]
MATRVVADAAGIARAAAVLQGGALVAFPTETVYGLGADARNDEAVRSIFAFKGRPADHPVIVHVESAAGLDHWGRDVPHSARRLAQAFWPGPLTLIVARRHDVSDSLTGAQDSVGLRCPSHRTARALLHAFAAGRADAGVAAPSANLFGRISPTQAAHVLEDFAGTDLLVLDDGPSLFGVESTIVDCSRPERGAVLLRHGAISREQVAAVIGAPVAVADAAAPRVSGSLESHYAPRKPLRLVSVGQIESLSAQAGRSALMAFGEPRFAASLAWFEAAPADPVRYAHRLYDRLRAMDASTAQSLYIEQVPATSDWAAVADRLQRASVHRVD